MVNILDTANIGQTASKVGSAFVTFLIWAGIIIVVSSIILIIVIWIKNKKTYNMPVRLIRQLENGTKKEMNGLKGGKVRKKGVFTFIVKIPHQFKKHDLGYMPDFSRTDGDNRLIFLSIGDGTLWQQIEETLVKKEKITIQLTTEQIEEQKKAIHDYVYSSDEFKKKSDKDKDEMINLGLQDWINKNKERTIEYDLIAKPIKTEVKTATINSLKSWQDILDRNKMKAFTIALGAFIIMVIAHLISLYIQTKIRCPGPAG